MQPTGGPSNKARAKAAWLLFRNLKAIASGLLYDVVRSVLVVMNLEQIQHKLHALGMDGLVRSKDSSMQGILFLYWLTVFLPLLRWFWMYPVLRKCFEQSRSVIASLVMASQISSLLAFEASERSDFVYQQRDDDTQIRLNRSGNPNYSTRQRFRCTFGQIASPDELRYLTNVPLFREREMTCNRDCKTQEAAWVSNAKACKTKPKHAYFLFLCHAFVFFPYLRSFYVASKVLPGRVGFLYKMKLWKSVFDSAFYIQSLRMNAFDPWDWHQSWSWHLKFAMAVWGFISMYKINVFCSGPWDCSRLGVVKSPFGQPENLWDDWTAAAMRNFKWDESSNMWNVMALQMHTESLVSLPVLSNV